MNFSSCLQSLNSTARATTPSFRLPSLAGALEYQSTLRTNTFGPVLLTCILIHHRLLSGINANPIDPDRPSFASSRMRVPTTNTGLTSDTSKARGSLPVVVNISSTQGSMSYASEIWSGGSTRDDLIFHPIYAASKVGLSGATMQLARELRVSLVLVFVEKDEMLMDVGRGYCELFTSVSYSTDALDRHWYLWIPHHTCDRSHLDLTHKDRAFRLMIYRGWVRTEAGRAYAPLSIDESASKMSVSLFTTKISS